jgi:hypothetical protein
VRSDQSTPLPSLASHYYDHCVGQAATKNITHSFTPPGKVGSQVQDLRINDRIKSDNLKTPSTPGSFNVHFEENHHHAYDHDEDDPQSVFNQKSHQQDVQHDNQNEPDEICAFRQSND